MDQAAKVTLAAELRARLGDVEAVYDRIGERERVPGPAGLESTALQLHNLYGAVEALLETVAEAFHNHVDGGAGYHTALLKRMSVDVPGIRPAVISGEGLRLFDTLRRFRHVVRHAYGAAIDERQLRIVLDDARAVRPVLRRDVERFLNALEPDPPGASGA